MGLGRDDYLYSGVTIYTRSWGVGTEMKEGLSGIAKRSVSYFLYQIKKNEGAQGCWCEWDRERWPSFTVVASAKALMDVVEWLDSSVFGPFGLRTG